MSEIKIEGIIKVKTYTIIEEAVERGIRYGYKRAYKHTDNPTEEQMIQEILLAAMSCLDEVVEF